VDNLSGPGRRCNKTEWRTSQKKDLTRATHLESLDKKKSLAGNHAQKTTMPRPRRERGMRD